MAENKYIHELSEITNPVLSGFTIYDDVTTKTQKLSLENLKDFIISDTIEHAGAHRILTALDSSGKKALANSGFTYQNDVFKLHRQDNYIQIGDVHQTTGTTNSLGLFRGGDHIIDSEAISTSSINNEVYDDDGTYDVGIGFISEQSGTTMYDWAISGASFEKRPVMILEPNEFDDPLPNFVRGIKINGSPVTGVTFGTNGTSGSSGISGVDGTDGTSGTSGSSGISGVDGTDGTSGSSGISGVDGTDGTSGTSGSSGISGVDGTDGTSGSSGTSGISGVDGTDGTSGTSGSSGTSGIGVSGSSGTSGSSGSSGTSGSSGSSGTSGVVTLYLLEAYASVTYTLPGGFTEDPCRYSVVSNTVNVSSAWFNTSTYTFTPLKAGYWEITAEYDVFRGLGPQNIGIEGSMSIKKNNSVIASTGSFGAVAQTVTKIVYLNGSTDFINVVNAGGNSQSRSQYEGRSWFQARWVGE